MKYIFQAREWTIDFYLQLEKELFIRDNNTIVFWLTMNKSVYNQLNQLNKKVYYLPEVFEKNSKIFDESSIRMVDDFIYKKYGYGIEFLFEIERFKPNKNSKAEFINGHINTLLEIIPENAKMISLTCDHFIFFISAYINELKGGTNYFIQPIGFPQNAQVIMHNPWDLNYFRNEPLNEDHLNQYIQSLDLDPKVSIHYMMPQKLISLKHSIFKRFKDLTLNKTSKNIFTYLEPQTKNIIPGRFRQKKKINYHFEYVLESALKSVSKKCNLFYFPLQFEPEMSILAYSPWYKSQLEVVRLISQSLKSGDILLLKENPKMIGKRDREFYDTISTFEHVRWAYPEINSRLIIRNSFKVISITGTATIEAACLGVDSLIFGHPPFRDLLIEKPIADQPLGEFVQILYRKHSPDEIVQHVSSNWDKFSRSVFFGNFIPTYMDNIISIKDSKLLAEQFAKEVLNI